jgi:hypothetical protein
MGTGFILPANAARPGEFLALDTRQRRHIENRLSPQIPLKGMLDVAANNERLYSGTRLVSPSSLYNCFGLVFAARRTWIFDAEAAWRSIKDDGYATVPFSPVHWEIGDIVLYCTETDNLTHVAIIVEVVPTEGDPKRSARVVSAWGNQGEYIHWINPGNEALGLPYEVRTLRRPKK